MNSSSKLSKLLFKNVKNFSNEEARELQILLNQHGNNLKVDGIVGPLTLASFNNFKLKNKLTVPDIFGPTTYQALLKKSEINLQSSINLIKEFEGFSSKAYFCPAGILTIGYGTTVYPDGSRVRQGDTVTVSQAELFLESYIKKKIIPTLENTIPFWTEMTQNQKNSLISFAYNLGENFYNSKGFATISRVLREKNWADVPKAMLLYINPGTTFTHGLIRRRRAEGLLFNS